MTGGAVRVSFLIPSAGGGERLGLGCKGSLELAGRPLLCWVADKGLRVADEVIVADGLSTDETVPIIRRLQGEYDNLKLIYNPVRYSSGGRNAGVRHMSGDYAVIVDGEVRITRLPAKVEIEKPM